MPRLGVKQDWRHRMDSRKSPRSSSGPMLRALPRGLGLALALALGLSAAKAAPASQDRVTPGLGASGAFLAGVVANTERDTAAAAAFFREALRADPRNSGLIDQAFLAELVDGNMDEAFRLAERAVQRDKSNALAHVALGVRSLRSRQYERAKASFERAGGTVREADLTISLLRSWAMTGLGEINGALQSVDRFKDNELRGYRDFFAGLIAESAKRFGEAENRLESAYKADPNILRVVDAYARILSRRGKMAEAVKVIEAWQQRNPNHPYLDRQAALLAKGEQLPPLASSIAEGTAEVFYGLGAVGSAARDPMSAVIYLQLARYLAPKDEVISTTLAEFFEQMRQHARAAQLYETIPAGSVLANRAAIGRAGALERMERTDEAIAVLRELLLRNPGDLEAADTLGSILRMKKRWLESVEVYGAAIASLPNVEQRHWPLFFGRAIGYERSKQWEKAEPDFLTALDLLPARPRSPRERVERAQVLNYLAYSWVDMRMNIEKSFEMLREAVAFSPGDGAIVDSLGWAFYRLGRYEDAVRELERAVLLKAGDPTINDHLGDAYWKVGRTREARFKWEQALGLNPEPEDIEKIRRKLETGLEEGPAANAAPPKPNGG
jgi:tetratricopeptide (TPR) repeat protein